MKQKRTSAAEDKAKSIPAKAPGGASRLNHTTALVGLIAVECLVLGWLFSKSFHADFVVFSNDGPLGFLTSAASRLPEAFYGFWQHLNWVGKPEASAAPNISWGLLYILGPLAFAKFYAPLSILLLGLAAWVFFRSLKFHPWVCALAALAVSLNMNIFSNVAWGLGSRALMIGCVFLALAALSQRSRGAGWWKTGLAGFAIGMAVMEGYDVGAIFSLYVAAFVIFLSWLRTQATKDEAPEGTATPLGEEQDRMEAEGEAPPQSGGVAESLGRGVVEVLVIAICAGLLSAHAVRTLVATQIQGVAKTEEAILGTGGPVKTPAEEAAERLAKWNFATQWSLPKAEAFRILVPGLFGYRMDPGPSTYWGRVGQTPGNPASRFSGAGEYLGMFVAVVALWALLQSFRGRHSVFDRPTRRILWFWGACALISLLLAFGRYAPFYSIIYPLPFFSNIRNPIKFTHPLHVSLLIVFAYGLQGIWRQYVERSAGQASASTTPGSLGDAFHEWRRRFSGFERQWAMGMLAASIAAGLVFLLYASSRGQVVRYLQAAMPGNPDHMQIALFSVSEVGWSVFFLLLTFGILTLVFCGFFTGARGRWAGGLIALILILDLGRADSPWIMFIQYKEKYASNPVIERLKQTPHEGRVTMPDIPVHTQLGPMYNLLGQVYAVEWMQHLFQYYNIQALNVIQLPRAPESYVKFNQALHPSPFGAQGEAFWQPTLRYWQLTNTRFLLSLASLAGGMNQQLAGGSEVFTNLMRFEFTQLPSGSIGTRAVTNGPFALIENRSALPRVGLYSHWEVIEDDDALLARLKDSAFDPTASVAVSSAIATSPGPRPETAVPGRGAEIVTYEPKRVVVQASPEARSILLLNDGHHPHWTVTVDGVPAPLLRCNYLMKGVLLEPGPHKVEFQYAPPAGTLYVSLGSIALSLGVVGWLRFGKRPDRS